MYFHLKIAEDERFGKYHIQQDSFCTKKLLSSLQQSLSYFHVDTSGEPKAMLLAWLKKMLIYHVVCSVRGKQPQLTQL